MCNQYQADILISGDVHEQLDESPDFKTEFIDNVRLKGKEQKIDIYSVSKLQSES